MIRKLVFLILLCIVVSSVWYFTPKQYNRTLEGVYFQLGNDQVFERIKIQFKGKIRNQINGSKSFKGNLKFEGNEIPKVPEDRTELELLYHGGNFSSVFSGFRIIDEAGRVTADIYQYGMIYINNNFTEFTIALTNLDNEETWNPTNGLMITAPVDNREEAIKISQKLMNKFRIELID
ncbi:hypothetical protein ACFO9Q_04940 [Paenibacillus sp. GCM10023252]|uniref:hypothetical protein n=1 Tax=Paenibacillus sp. GCM10023252 TaxID=3252649 RepID=UPI0036103E39